MFEPSMNREQIEDAYDQSKWASNMEDVLFRYRLLSDAVRASVGEPMRVAYGPAPDEQMDHYRAGKELSPVVIFIHGGGWQRGSSRDYGFPAELLLSAGIQYVALDFSTIAAANNDLSVLVDQVRRAIIHIYRNCALLGGDVSQLYVAGHSSGAHLAAMALSTCWTNHGLTASPIRGGFLISGIYDLAQLRHTSRSTYVHIDDRIERKLSPIRQTRHLTCPLTIAVGSKESPEYQRQARDYAELAIKSDNPVKLVVGETYNHFDILETLANPYGLLGRHLLEMVKYELLQV